jgi:type IV secretion system protein VirB9
MKLKIRRWSLLTVILGLNLAQASSVQTWAYQPGRVYTLSLSPLYVTSLHFQGSKAIESIHCGDPSAWEILRSRVTKHSILIKPKLSHSETDLIVKVDKKTVLFKLQSVPKRDSPLIYANLIFPSARHHQKENYYHGYCFKGNELLRPVWMYDNGVSTYFSWKKNMPFPAVYRLSADCQQRYLTNFRVNKQVFLLPKVSQNWLLKRGKRQALLTRMVGGSCHG